MVSPHKDNPERGSKPNRGGREESGRDVAGQGRGDVGPDSPAHEPAGSTDASSGTSSTSGTEEQGRTRGISRRRLFTTAGFAGLAGIAGAGIGGLAVHAAENKDKSDPTSLVYPFRGEHQQGITTPAQDNMYTAAFDITTDDVDDLKDMLTSWTSASEQMCAGELIGGEPNANPKAVPRDTGEAWDYPVGGLTITFGFGKGLFVDGGGKDRFGLKAKMPDVIKEGMPKFANEALRSEQSDGDLLVQVCSNDAQVCVHAIRNLTRIGFGTVRLRWGQIGYGRTSSTSTDQDTPRNLFGFKDGTQNIKSDETDALDKDVWVTDGWMAGGSYFVARKIHMYLEVWDRVILEEQEDVIGRDKRYGAPLSVEDPSDDHEFDDVDYTARRGGKLAVPADSHVAVVAPEHNKGHRMLRRGYNYTDGNDSLGRLNAGLFFIAYSKDPREGFYPILKKMTEKDAMTEYLQHQASALFAVPGGIREGDSMVGQRLFE